MKINYDRPKLTSSTINQKKDFDQLSKLHSTSTLPFFKKGWFIGTLASSLLLIGVVIYLNSLTNKSTPVALTTVAERQTSSNKEINSTQVTYLEDTPCIKPPSDNLKIPYQIYKVNPNNAQTIVLEKSKLIIPSHSFLDSINNIIKDTVIIKIKVMNDPVDFILSGVPMEYDSAGLTYTFESGGMIEVIGTDLNNTPISINNKITIQFDANKNTKDFNFYELDATKGEWNYLISNTLIKEEKEFEADKTHSFNTTDWQASFRTQNIANQKWKRAEEEVVIHQKKKPNSPNKVKNASQTFTLDIDKNQFPELASFTQQQFEPAASNLDPSIYNTEWTSIKLREHKKGISYQLILQNSSTIKTLIAKPVYEGKQWAKAQHIYSDKFARYTAILEQKEEKAKTLKEDYEKKKKQFDAIDELKGKVKEITKKVAISLAAPIQNFGIFNFDRPLLNRPKSDIPPTKDKEVKVKEQPKFADINGKEFDFEKIYVVESKQNACFAYDLKKSPYFSYNENATISIIGFNDGKELVLINNKDFKSAIQSGAPFVGKRIENTTITELKSLILKI